MSWKHWYLTLNLLVITSIAQATSLPFIIKKIPTTNKVIALTFDDGPKQNTTQPILDILKKHQITATFFLVGKQVEKNPNIAQSILDHHHTIGNHSYSHKTSLINTNASLRKDIAKSQLIFYNTLKVFPLMYRPPYGKIHQSQIPVLKQEFLHCILWNIDPKDWTPTQSSQNIIKYILQKVEPGSIVVLHSSKKTAKLLPKLIKKLKKKKYSFIELSALIN